MSPAPTDLDPLAGAPDLEQASAAEVVAWAHDRFGDGLVVTASFEDAVLVHLVSTAAPGAAVVLLDTQYLFAETHWYSERLTRRLRLNLIVVRPGGAVVPDDRWQHDVEGCCGVRKVEPLNRALAGKQAWITGLRRVDGPTRAGTPVASWDDARGVVKINPLAAFTDEDIDRYHHEHDLPRHPLTERGYPSIGCWPCTRPVAPGEDRRAGRWSGSAKTECGLHLERRVSDTHRGADGEYPTLSVGGSS